MIRIRSYDSWAEFLADSSACLASRECENSLPLGIAARLAARSNSSQTDQPVLISISDGVGIVGTAIMTPPRKLILSCVGGDSRAATRALAEFLQEAAIPVPGVVGPSGEAGSFADDWTRLNAGRKWEIDTRMRLFECRRVNDVELADGRLRTATAEDIPLASCWDYEFCAAIGEPVDLDESNRNVRGYIAEQSLHFWDTGTPVSMAKQSRPTTNGITVNMVYTPRQLRGRGYATTCVHHLTRKLLDQGYSFCALYTDLANPTSNSIYRKIGYLPVGDSLDLGFSDGWKR